MLCELHVRNLLIVAEARLEPGRGLCVISGETGAGKSLLLDALALLLGARGSARMVGPHGETALVSAVIALDAQRAQRLGERLGLELGEQVVFRRRIASSGRSQAWIDEVPVAVQALRDAGRELVDVRVQHEHLRLGDEARQLALIDRFGQHLDCAERYRAAHERCLALQRELDALQAGERDSLRELDYQQFLLRELDDLQPRAGELHELQQRQALLASAQDWQQLADEALTAFTEDDRSIAQVLAGLGQRLCEAPDERLADAGRNALQAAELTREAAFACAAARDDVTVDDEALARVEARLLAYTELMRKHGRDEGELLDAHERIRARVDDLHKLDARNEACVAELADADADRERVGEELAARRREAFAALAEVVHVELAELGMDQTRLSLEDEPQRKAGPLGVHRQRIMVRTNPGLPPGPLAEVPSGGESARLTLALAVALADADDMPVLVFDEVDSGVGGRLGSVMGRKLVALGRQRSILAVTHTPQLAAAADRHYAVRKCHDDDATRVLVEELRGERRLSELAEMLGGGRAAREQASALLGGSRTVET